MDKHWALNYEPYRGKNHYVIWVSGEGEIAEIICKDKTVVDKMAASKDMYEALRDLAVEVECRECCKGDKLDNAFKAVSKAEGEATE